MALGCLRSSFFFSSRRRHTRFDCDWSSDVCSSDLNRLENEGFDVDTARQIDNQRTECLAKLLLKALVESPHILLVPEEEPWCSGTLRLNQPTVQHIEFQDIDRILRI